MSTTLSTLMTDLNQLNHSLFLWLNHGFHALPDWFWASVTITGHTSMVFALLSPLLLLNYRVITALLIAAPLGGLVSTVLKESFQALRPPAVLTPEQFHLIGHKLELVSFPSGHTLTAFAVATMVVLGLRWRGWRLVIAGLLAFAVGLSRIAVGAHWPLDVLAGALVGMACGWTATRGAEFLHYRFQHLDHPHYRVIQTLLIGGVSASLAGTKMGYPDAQTWQYLIFGFGVLVSVLCLISHIKSFKSR